MAPPIGGPLPATPNPTTARDAPVLWTQAWFHPLFTDPETATFENTQTVDRETLVERVASTGVVAALEAEQCAKVLKEIRDLIDTHPETRDRTKFENPYRTRVYTFRRVP